MPEEEDCAVLIYYQDSQRRKRKRERRRWLQQLLRRRRILRRTLTLKTTSVVQYTTSPNEEVGRKVDRKRLRQISSEDEVGMSAPKRKFRKICSAEGCTNIAQIVCALLQAWSKAQTMQLWRLYKSSSKWRSVHQAWGKGASMQ